MRGGRSPGKIDASLNEKLRRVKWGEYKLGELFEICSSKKIFHANELPEIYESKVSGSFPYVVRSTQNNGVKGYIKENYDYANDGGTLSFAQDTFSVFYQKEKYFTGNKVKILKPLFNVKNENVLIFIVAGCNNSLKALSWGMGSTVETIENFIIQLPQTENGKIDYEFMETFVAKLQFRRVAELEAYLSATGLKDYTLTKEETEAYHSLFTHKSWGKYKLGDLFTKIKTNSLHYKTSDLPSVSDNIYCLPALTAGIQNQGLNNFVPYENATVLQNVISISANGANTGATFYQSQKFTVLQDAYAIKWIYTNNKLTDKQYLFLTGSISKAIYGTYEWTNKAGWERIKNNAIFLPQTENGKIDFEYIELLISAIQKIVIKNVVLYADKQIAKTQKVINKNF